MRQGILGALLLLSAAAPVWAGPGKTTANFLKIGVGPRAVSMGESYTALADDVTAIHYNPAGLAGLNRQEAAFMHNEFFDGVRQEWGAYAFPSQYYGTFAASYNYLMVEKMDAYDTRGVKTGQVDAADMAASIAYANEFGTANRLAFGTNAKYIESRLYTYKAHAFALDGGLLWLSDKDGTWRLGASVRNLGNKMKFIEEEFFLPMSLHAGISYNAPMPHPLDYLGWTFTAEAAKDIERPPYMAGGFEIRLPINLYLRAGYRDNMDSGMGLSGGFGVRSLEKGFTGPWWPEMQLDYAFVDFGRLDRTHRIAITIRFGENKQGEYVFPVRAEELRFY
ncbi:MAG TPA: hypothetical protein DD417_17280 [Elusimicrobia bacterium]|nr:hypothetical protein [Elusimicrobiota bacterium]